MIKPEEKMRTWAEIDLSAIKHNTAEFKKKLADSTKLLAVVKADAYGHGALEVSLAALNSGADELGVATLEEAVYLRNSGIDAPILILGIIFDDEIENLIKFDITATVTSYDYALNISNEAKKQNKTAKIHIKLDTGMSRIGYTSDSDYVAEIKKIALLPNIYIEGIFSHFSKADEENIEYTEIQFDRFVKMCGKLEENGIKIPVKHISNSAGIMRNKKYHLDMVRLGISLYGQFPSDIFEKEKFDIKLLPAMTLKSRVAFVKEVPKNVHIGYNGTFVTNKTTMIATVAIGYADGYSRSLSNKGYAIVKGKICKIIGNVCMDQLMLDVTGIKDIKFGDEVILFGSFGNTIINVDDVAALINTNSYELLCHIGKRVPRIYIQ